MRVYYLQNENNEIIEDGIEPFNPACLSMERENYHIRNGYNGALFFCDYMETDEYKQKEAAYREQSELNRLRDIRNSECFSIVNRGALWYERLTDAQKTELNTWYQAWLDVTETLTIPTKPIWLD